MDLQSALVCVLVFVLSGAILLLISMFGMREKSYEEALAEQRQLTGGLLNTGRPKPKDKKQKKAAGKKVKEKQTTVETSESDEIEKKEDPQPPLVSSSFSKPPTTHGHGKLHVEFEENAVLVDSSTVNKKKTKKDKVKPILLNKEKTPVGDGVKTGSTNHFEKSHPKDEFEMLHAHKEEKHETEVKSTKPSKSKTEKVEKETTDQQTPAPKLTREGKKDKKQQQQQQPVEEPAIVQQQNTVFSAKSAPSSNGQPTTSNVGNSQGVINTVKDKKKKKSEFNTLQQMTANDRHGVNVSLLVPLVRKADLSRSEIQILIDLLLNKQHEAPAIIDEWSEGRADPVQKLKRQLAEKERLLTEEQEALVSAQAKLRELRAELNSERSKVIQNQRSLEETVLAKNNDMQQAAARLHTQNQKIQQLQSQLNDEVIVTHKLRQELNSMQLQRQQMDLHLNQKQETEASFQAQVSQLRNELQEQQNVSAQLNKELRNLRETNLAEKDLLLERIRQFEREATQYKNEFNQREIIQRQLEDYGKRLQKQVSTLEKEKVQLEAANGAASEDRSKEIEILNLQNELASLKVRTEQRETQLTAIIEESKKALTTAENELQTQKNKNDELRKKNWKVMEALNVAEASLHTKQKKTITVNCVDDASLKKLKSEEEEKCRKFLQRLFSDVKLSDNNETWMADAEKAIKKYITELKEREVHVENSAIAQSTASVDTSRLQAQIINYRNIIEDTEGMLNKLQSHVEIEETNWRKQLQAKDVEIEALKAQNKMQKSHQNTPNFGNESPSDDHGVKFAFKCIERSLPVIVKELQSQINELEEKLQAEKTSKEELLKQCNELQNRLTSIGSQTNVKQVENSASNLAEIEQISEEKNRLEAELLIEQKRSQELTEELLRLKSNDVNSIPIKILQNHNTSNGTSTESTDLPNSASSSSVSPTSTKPRNKKNKKKATVSN